MHGSQRAERPWWERELPAIEQLLRDHVRRRLPTLNSLHDDLVNETLAALSERIQRDPSVYPPSWMQNDAPSSEAERSYLVKLALTILRRRTADLFRQGAHRWGTSGEPNESDAGDEPSAERKTLLARMLRICVGVLADLSSEDRDLLTSAAGLDGPDATRALNDRERQRLRRARQRLIEEIRARMGESVADLLDKD